MSLQATTTSFKKKLFIITISQYHIITLSRSVSVEGGEDLMNLIVKIVQLPFV